MIDLKQILPKQLRKKNGVYCIYNKISNKYYFGSTGAQTGLYQRWQNHLNSLRKNKHENSHLQRAWNIYGEDAFQFRVRLVCKSEFCTKIEQKYLDICLRAKESYTIFRKSGYNMKPIAGSSLGYKFTEEQKKNISKGIQKAGGNKGKYNPRFGTIISEEQKNKTKETWLKTGFIKPVCLINKELDVVGTFDTIKEAAKYLNCDPSLIGAVLKNKCKTAKGHIPCYKNELQNKLNTLRHG